MFSVKRGPQSCGNGTQPQPQKDDLTEKSYGGHICRTKFDFFRATKFPTRIFPKNV